MADGYLSVWESSQKQKDVEVLTATTDESIAFFSKINLVCVSSDSLLNNIATGSSRDDPTGFSSIATTSIVKEHSTACYASNTKSTATTSRYLPI
jgi:hypothetical protein